VACGRSARARTLFQLHDHVAVAIGAHRGHAAIQGVTVSVPFCTLAPWIEQKNGNVPGVLKIIGGEKPFAGT
jgi:hypothetical protein